MMDCRSLRSRTKGCGATFVDPEVETAFLQFSEEPSIQAHLSRAVFGVTAAFALFILIFIPVESTRSATWWHQLLLLVLLGWLPPMGASLYMGLRNYRPRGLRACAALLPVREAPISKNLRIINHSYLRFWSEWVVCRLSR